ncbi:hypothetical protein NDU88_003177 [Pleurodeles waltl]|uniref:Uncharacterized protein n=1 Tax=Pleurodeles waltl TaxID=8319 RepID=A0AAV7KU61_PLEWA|nr:hypothetical protein NDU88_003177 [Pleurodeles waltl]
MMAGPPTDIACIEGEVQEGCRQRGRITPCRCRGRTALKRQEWLRQAKLRVVDGKATQMLSAPKDVWRWLYAKGLIPTPGEEQDMRTWLTHRDKRRPHRPHRTRPTRAQVAKKRADAVLEASQLTLNPFHVLDDQPSGDPGSEEDTDL